MTVVFADTHYWVAVANRLDQWSAVAARVVAELGDYETVTTDEVLVEFLGFMSGLGPRLRDRSVQVVEAVMHNPQIAVIPQSHGSFLDGLALYQARPDKGYSLVDCISMITMRAVGFATC